MVNLFEKVMYNRMIEFAEQYNILHRYQFGFRITIQRPMF